MTYLPDVQSCDVQHYNFASVIYAITDFNFNVMLETVANWEESITDSRSSSEV
jgi:hypothetical protein